MLQARLSSPTAKETGLAFIHFGPRLASRSEVSPQSSCDFPACRRPSRWLGAGVKARMLGQGGGGPRPGCPLPPGSGGTPRGTGLRRAGQAAAHGQRFAVRGPQVPGRDARGTWVKVIHLPPAADPGCDCHRTSLCASASSTMGVRTLTSQPLGD